MDGDNRSEVSQLRTRSLGLYDKIEVQPGGDGAFTASFQRKGLMDVLSGFMNKNSGREKEIRDLSRVQDIASSLVKGKLKEGDIQFLDQFQIGDRKLAFLVAAVSKISSDEKEIEQKRQGRDLKDEDGLILADLLQVVPDSGESLQ